MYHSLHQTKQINTFKISLGKVLTAIKLFALFIFWRYGLFLIFFTGWVIAMYFFFDAVTGATLPPELKEDIMHTPQAGKTIFIIVCGRKVAIKCTCYVKKWKQQYLKGNS